MDDRQRGGCCHNSKNRQTRITVLAFLTFVIFVNICMNFHEDIFKHFKSESSKKFVKADRQTLVCLPTPRVES